MNLVMGASRKALCWQRAIGLWHCTLPNLYHGEYSRIFFLRQASLKAAVLSFGVLRAVTGEGEQFKIATPSHELTL